jgi:hypothetical protein
MRRLIHLGLAVILMFGVRSCGADESAQRVSNGLEWFSEKTGLTAATKVVREGWDVTAGAVTRKVGNEVHGIVVIGLRGVEFVLVDVPAAAWKRITDKGTTIGDSLRSWLRGGAKTASRPDNQDEDGSSSPAGGP